ncbi:hypothetical protein PFISCL1PPCAC_14401, partial [Pristionchus fissidentatus]
HYSVCSVGTTVNVVLLFTIFTKTPQTMRPYAVLLTSMSILQTISCFTSMMCFPRLVPLRSSVLVMLSGPVLWLNTDWLSYSSYMIMMHGHAHYSIMITVCFSYRYYILLHPSPTVKETTILSFLIYIPTVIVI